MLKSTVLILTCPESSVPDPSVPVVLSGWLQGREASVVLGKQGPLLALPLTIWVTRVHLLNSLSPSFLNCILEKMILTLRGTVMQTRELSSKELSS